MTTRAIHELDVDGLAERLRRHLRVLTHEIGERSVGNFSGHHAAADYIARSFQEFGLSVTRESYAFGSETVDNILAEDPAGAPPGGKRYLLGAHYDSVTGTVGADDNASAVAVVLETARLFRKFNLGRPGVLQVQFAAFALEEPPAYGTRHMGSRVRVRNARRSRERIDGMICLEMVGYTCMEPGCQHYPFPLMWMDYPDVGDFIGIVANGRSKRLLRRLKSAFLENPELPVITLHVPLNGWVLPSVRLSDHAPFWDAGYPAVMITDTAFYRNPHYHTTGDTAETLDYPFMARLVKSLLLFFASEREAAP